MNQKSGLMKLFWWTFGLFAILVGALVLLAMSSPDGPFSYVLQ